ncbi:hypothetical protein [Coleofasciculus sp.]|uniref:hypothetical protein n=1 Tax=Coleofasciculus sp. TaxID=3100458 RepID=UPI003A2995FF
MTQNLTKLQLTNIGWTDGFAIWRVRNLNDIDIQYNWDVYETGQAGQGIALAKYDVFFYTSLVRGPNTARVLVNGIQQMVKSAHLNYAFYHSIEPLPEPIPPSLELQSLDQKQLCVMI